MTDDPTLEILETIIGMEAQFVVMRQMMVFLVADRFNEQNDPEKMLRALSDGISTALSRTAEASGDKHLATERIRVELDKFVEEIGRVLRGPGEPV